MALALALVGCKDDDPPASAVCSGDYSQVSSAEISLEHDLMPIFGASCTFSSCHDSSARKAGLVLGDRSGSTSATPDLLAEIRHSLLAPSTTVKTPVVPRVTPRDPSNSFLLDKLTNTQNSRGYECQSQDSSGSSAGPCGGAMPYGSDDYCATETTKVVAIVEWIRNGAPQN